MGWQNSKVETYVKKNFHKTLMQNSLMFSTQCKAVPRRVPRQDCQQVPTLQVTKTSFFGGFELSDSPRKKTSFLEDLNKQGRIYAETDWNWFAVGFFGPVRIWTSKVIYVLNLIETDLQCFFWRPYIRWTWLKLMLQCTNVGKEQCQTIPRQACKSVPKYKNVFF